MNLNKLFLTVSPAIENKDVCFNELKEYAESLIADDSLPTTMEFNNDKLQIIIESDKQGLEIIVATLLEDIAENLFNVDKIDTSMFYSYCDEPEIQASMSAEMHTICHSSIAAVMDIVADTDAALSELTKQVQTMDALLTLCGAYKTNEALNKIVTILHRNGIEAVEEVSDVYLETIN